MSADLVMRRFLGLGALLLLVVASACSTEPKLAALLADPMAEYDAEGIVLQRREEQAEGTSLLGKRTVAQVLLIYRQVDAARWETTLANAVEDAESVGWRVHAGLFPGVFQGTKQLGSDVGRLSISADMPGEDQEDSNLLIILDYGPVRDPQD